MKLNFDDITGFLKEELGVATNDIAPETKLFSTGTIDSFGLVSLLSHLEAECSIKIRASDVNLDNFDSISRMLNYVENSAVA